MFTDRDDDYIDFPVSALWREHYAAQGLTYDIGRRRQSEPPRYPVSVESSETLHLLKATIKRQEAEIHALKAALFSARKHSDFEGAE